MKTFGKKAMKLKLVLLLSVASIGFAHAEAITQQDYDQHIEHYTQVIKQTKVILDDPDSKADAKMQSQALCDRLNAYEQIAQLSKENSQLELAPMMLMVAQTYLNKQQKSLTKSGMSTNVFCAGKIK